MMPSITRPRSCFFNRRHFGSSVLALLAALALAVVARAQGLHWEITSFDVTVHVQEDGSLDVAEHLIVDFTREPHRGIIRQIPYAYRRSGTDFELRIDVVSITDQNDRPHPFQVSRSGGQENIRIGDPGRYLQETVHYRIHYRVKRAMLSFPTHDELYWNAIGADWPVPIRSAACEVILPPEAVSDPAALRTASFTGPHGSAAPGPRSTITDDGHVRFEQPEGLEPWTALTIVIGFPPGHVRAPTAATRFGWFLADNAILVAPLLVFAGLLLLWRWQGRDRGRPDTVVVSYEPPDNLTPVEVGSIIDERVDNHDVTATIIDLAVRGYLNIEVSTPTRKTRLTPKRVHVRRTAQPLSDLKPFERTIVEGLVKEGQRVSLDSLKAKFYPTLTDVRSQVYDTLDHDGYFAGHFGHVRTFWYALALAATILTIIVTFALIGADTFGPAATLFAGVLTAPQFLLAAGFMPRRTAKGRRALEKIRGLEEYITRAELEDLDEAARRHTFERLLPYAMALNLSAIWAKRFEHLYDQPPQWFTTTSPDTFTTAWLVGHLNRTSTVMTTSLSTAPRSVTSSWSSGGFGGGSSGFSGGGGSSGGGGFSGGGGGGGGGGAW